MVNDTIRVGCVVEDLSGNLGVVVEIGDDLLDEFPIALLICWDGIKRMWGINELKFECDNIRKLFQQQYENGWEDGKGSAEYDLEESRWENAI